jgi:FkbM family methyltransferase
MAFRVNSRQLKNRFDKLIAAMRVFGVGGAFKVLLYSRARHVPWGLFSLRIPGVQHPIYCRTGTSDAWVLKQVFLEREYAPLDRERNVRVVFDCGANVGYSSLYFLNQFPSCRVIAVEPDPDNLELLRMNLKPYGSRVEIVTAGVWSTATRLVIVRRGEAWATQVRAATPGEMGDLPAVDIASLMHRAGVDRVDVLKVDIEGSEAEVFSANVDTWLPRIGSLAIELHGQRCTEIVEKALSSYHFKRVSSGELSIFLDIRPELAVRNLGQPA